MPPAWLHGPSLHGTTVPPLAASACQSPTHGLPLHGPLVESVLVVSIALVSVGALVSVVCPAPALESSPLLLQPPTNNPAMMNARSTKVGHRVHVAAQPLARLIGVVLGIIRPAASRTP